MSQKAKDDCDGAFVMPITITQSCMQCGEQLQEHEWYPDIFTKERTDG